MNQRLNLPPESDIKKVLHLDGSKLPSFPQVAAKLIEASKDETVSLEEVSKIVETDPGISARILEMVNSAFYGLGRQITTLSEGVVMLGLDEIKKLTLSMTIFENMFKKGKAEEFNRLLFWRHSIAVAVLCKEIAQATDYPDPGEAYIAGLLHDVGKIFLDLSGRENYGDFIQSLSSSTDLVIEEERSRIGLGHDDIGAFFCTLWKLPEKLLLAVKYHHQPFEHLGLSEDENKLIAIVSMANFLCWTQGIGSFDFIRPPLLCPEVEKIIDPDKLDIIDCILKMNTEVESISAFYKFVFPSVDQLKENLLWANLKLSRANTRYYYKEDPLATLHPTLTQEDEETATDVGFQLGKPLAKAKSVKEVLDIVMYQVGRIFQPLHWSVLLKNPKTQDMVFSVVVGTNKEKLQGAKLPKGEGIAGHIMETGESVIIDDVSKDSRFSSRVDKYTGFQTKSIIGTPLKTDDKIFGVIELINRVNEEPFSLQDLTLLSSIAEYAAIALERSYYNQTLTNMATRDTLTGLKNRWSFEKTVSNKTEFQIQFGTVFSILVVTVRGLDRLDNDKAEARLKTLAQVLKKTRRRGDSLYRYADNAFISLLPLTYSDGADQAKERIKKAMAGHPNLLASLTLQANTMQGRDAGQLKALVARALASSKPPAASQEKVTDIQENLQPLLEKERKEEADKMEKIPKFGKTVSLTGNFRQLKTGESGRIGVEQVSMTAIGFRISKSHRLQVNDFIDVQFTLDDMKRSVMKRRAVIREVQGNYFKAEYYNPPPYDKTLGFYVLS